jgi:hypothetical protein
MTKRSLSIFVSIACCWTLGWSLEPNKLSISEISFKEFFKERLGISKDQDGSDMIAKRSNNNLLRSKVETSDVDPTASDQLHGFVEYETWDGINCNGTQTSTLAYQTDYCNLHSSGNGSYKLQFDGGLFQLFLSIFSLF